MQLCTRCHAHRRMPKQRWCRACFTAYRRQQRAKPPTTSPDRQATPTGPLLTRFWCRQYPFLRIGIPGGGVQFQDGLLETADPVVIEAVRRNDWYGGIITEGEAPPPPPAARPAPEQPRAYPPTRPRRLLGDWTYPWRADDR